MFKGGGSEWIIEKFSSHMEQPKKYAEPRVNVDAALENLNNVSLSTHCW